ncbi:MAG: DUF3494 domain-containing protein [Bacteroidetes bacterium]|nr:DUF3494 domain-containing protein [Bacteroidota bacterium]
MKTYTKNRKGILHRFMSLLGTGLISVLMLHAVAFSQQAPVTLGSTGRFAILSYAGITNTGPTSITGDVGASPITGASMTGFETVALVGTIYTVDAAGPTGYVTDATMLTQAMLDLTTAYNDAAGRTVNPIGIAGNLGGRTLPPGLYKSTSSLEISSGDLTLDAQGDANAVWIFQIASSFNMTSGRQVFLIGGAKASNIFWQVGSAATFGTTAVMKGTIIAYANITFATGSSLEGRALARTASVTLDANTISQPVLAAPADTAAASHITVSGTNAGDVAPVVTGGGFINVVNNGAHVVATQTGTGTINIVNNGGGLTATNTGNGVMTINSTATGFVTVTNTGNGRVNVTATGSAPITLTHTGDNDFTYPSSLAKVTAVNVSTSPLPVTLGLTGRFAILSYAGITNTGPTSITGDVGASPITGASMTGFETVALVGTIYTVDASGPTGYVTDATMLTQAMLDLTTAFNDAAGRTVNPIGIAGNLGGQTLPPGLYKSTSSLEISSGDLTLDAQGDANAVWIFQIASSFNMTSGRQVFLIGGAKASNIFWQVGSAATFGTTAVMKGTIMAYANITFATGASLEGRALARTASVTLDANTIGGVSVATIPKSSGPTIVQNGSVPKEFALSQNYPNPFNPSTKIQYTIGNPGLVSLKVYDVLGNEVATLVNSNQEAGSYTVLFNTGEAKMNLSSGVYFYRLEAGSFVSIKKLTLLK